MALGFGAAASLAAVQSQARSTLEAVRERGTLLAGVRFDAPPNGYVSPQGEIIGFGPDLARALARPPGAALEPVQGTSNNHIPLLQSGKNEADESHTQPNKQQTEEE